MCLLVMEDSFLSRAFCRETGHDRDINMSLYVPLLPSTYFLKINPAGLLHKVWLLLNKDSFVSWAFTLEKGHKRDINMSPYVSFMPSACLLQINTADLLQKA